MLALVAGLAAYFAAVEHYYAGVAPREGETLAELSQRTEIGRVLRAQRDGAAVYFVYGDVPPSYVLSSGAPVYVIDAEGRVVDWISDSGDQPTPMANWGVEGATEIPFEQALRECVAAARSRDLRP